MKTNKQIQTDNSKCIKEINGIIKSVRLLNQYEIIAIHPLSVKHMEKVIKETCKKYKTNIDHIKTLLYGNH